MVSPFIQLRVAQETAAEEVAEKQRKTSISSDKGVEKLAYIRGRVIDELLQTEKDFVGHLKFVIQVRNQDRSLPCYHCIFNQLQFNKQVFIFQVN